jgi:hypothetical protein
MMPLNPDFMGKAYGALMSELGRRACREGWGVALFEFVAERGRWPDDEEKRQIIAHAAELAEAAGKLPAFARGTIDRKAARYERIANGLE